MPKDKFAETVNKIAFDALQKGGWVQYYELSDRKIAFTTDGINAYILRIGQVNFSLEKCGKIEALGRIFGNFETQRDQFEELSLTPDRYVGKEKTMVRFKATDWSTFLDTKYVRPFCDATPFQQTKRGEVFFLRCGEVIGLACPVRVSDEVEGRYAK